MLGIAKLDPVARARDEAETGPIEARPVPDRHLDGRPEIVAAVREEADALAQAAEDGGLVKDAPQPFEGRAFVADDMIRSDGPDQAE